MKMSSTNDAARRAETRNKIQLGGLVHLAGLCEIFKIKPGDDLQLDMQSREDSAAMLGYLDEAAQYLRENLNSIKLEQYKRRGIALLKQSAAKKYY